jgi:hypothetical protein
VLFGKADPDRPEDYCQFISPRKNWVQQTFEHTMIADREGRVPVAVVNPKLGAGGLGVYVKYQSKNLPKYIEWRMMGEGQYALGIEPCTNCFGREQARSSGQVIVLSPGEKRPYDLEVGVLESDGQIQNLRNEIEKLRKTPY